MRIKTVRNIFVQDATIQQFMPTKKIAICRAAFNLTKQIEKGDEVILSAISPKAIQLEVKKPNGEIVKASNTDLREIAALSDKLDKEDALFNSKGYYLEKPEIKQAMKSIEDEYNKNLNLIRHTPYNFEEGLLEAYRKTIKKPEVVMN